MKHASGLAAMLAATMAAQPGAAPLPCMADGVPAPCALPPRVPADRATPPAAFPQRRPYPPQWYYNPYDVPWMHCRMCGEM